MSDSYNGIILTFKALIAFTIMSAYDGCAADFFVVAPDKPALVILAENSAIKSNINSDHFKFETMIWT